MKKLFIAVAAIAAAVACNTAEIVDLPSNPAISFENAFVQNASRAAVDPSITTASIDAFDVWAFMDETTGTVLVDETVSKVNGKWSYANVQYWAPGHEYYFGALAPANSANWSLDTTSADKTGAGLVTFTNVDGSEDLLYASTHVSTADLKLGESMEAVKLTFSHLLSKVKFTFTNGFATDNVTINVKNVTMSAVSKATLALNNEWWNGDNWTIAENALTLNFGSVAETLAAGAKAEADVERLTIPTAADYVYNVKFYVDVYFGTVKAIDNHEFTASISNVALQMGKAYNFAATINPENLEMAPIVFDIIEVKDWIVATTPDEQIKDAELRAAAQFGGEVTLNESLEISAPIEVKQNLIVNLNGHDLTAGLFAEAGGKISEGDTDSYVFWVQEGATLTINGEGNVTTAACKYSIPVWAKGGNVVINGGYYQNAGEGSDLIYASAGGHIEIYGGTFVANESKSEGTAEAYSALNLKDNSGSSIVVYGGSFYKFDPANNKSENPAVNFVAEGYSSIADGDWFLVVGGEYDNLARVATIDELQAALDAATGNALIVVGADLVGNATANQAEGVNLTIDGAGYKFDGTLTINGKNRYQGTETLVVKNVAFESASKLDFISSNVTKWYAHNVTIENCSFAGNADAVGMRFRQAYNLLIKNCVANGIHSLSQNTSCSYQKYEGCTVEAGRGLNILTSGNVDVVNCNFKATEADGYGVRVDAAAGNVLNVTGSTIEAYEPIVLRNAKASYELNLLNNTLTAASGYEIVVIGEEPVINGAAGLNIKK